MTSKHTLNASKRALLLTTALVTMTFAAPKAYAVSDLTTPTGEVVVGGAATFDRPVAGLLNVTQTTDRAVINWSNFDIGAKATTNFVQPSAGSLAVNRVLSAGVDPTQILGKLNANGKVMILDRNGVFIGKDAKINVGAIVAGAGDVATSQVMSGSPTIRIDNMAPNATVENQGRITAADAGLVALVAPTVKNSGTITAKLGKVGFGSGTKVIVDLYGDGLISVATDSKLSHALIENSGKIAAEGGTVQMSTSVAAGIVSNAINNSGMVDVSSVTVKGGKIVLAGGTSANVNNSGKLYAQSAVEGGKIKMTGHNVDVSGVANAESTGGKGGRVDIDASENNATVNPGVRFNQAQSDAFIAPR
jgi:filamentous hemagglutinin family protein